MNIVREYVAELDHETCCQIHAQGKTWEKTGCVDDGPLRENARKIVAKTGIETSNLSHWMLALMNEVWRRYAVKELE